MALGETTDLYEGDLRRLTRLTRIAVSFFGMVLLATVAFAGWSANRAATETERSLLENAFNQSIANVLDGQKSVAWWDESVTKIGPDAIDLDFTDSNFGVFLTETYGHDEVYILDAQDRPLYAYSDATRHDPADFEKRRAVLAPVISEARGGASTLKARPDLFLEAQKNYRVLAGAVEAARWSGHIFSVGGRYAVVAALTIVPNVELTLLKGTPKLLISVVYIDADFISKLSRTLLLPTLSLTPNQVLAGSYVSDPFVGDDGGLVGYLPWETRRPGQFLLAVLLPLLACGVFATGMFCNDMFARLKLASEELTQREARSRHEAKHDALSGLPNRQNMIEKVEAWLRTSDGGRSGEHAVAAYVDIDRFKDINDTLGHEVGDKLIKAVGRRLKARLRTNDFLARFGGDEFAVMCISANAQDAAARLAARITNAFDEPFAIDGQNIRASVSVGLAMAPEHGQTADQLMRHADIALYEAKRLGRDRAVSFSAEMAREVETRRAIEVDLRAAIERGELRLHYQPIVSCRTGAIVGAEALLRWRHPMRGDISPATFIPIAEVSGMMPALGNWIIERAIKDAKLWPDLEIAVNLSPMQFGEADFAGRLQRLTSEHDVAPERIVLEITEGVLLEATDHTKEVLQSIQAMGFKTALDDFGTGYSSLSYLCNFKFDKIKIDRSFVSNVSNALASRTIVQSVVSLGRGLGMSIVAEGVETDYDALMMNHLGCTEMQGFHFSKPLEAAQLTSLLERFVPRVSPVTEVPQLETPPHAASA
jgi:diguanylate cyclase (GGDEF)-like protein